MTYNATDEKRNYIWNMIGSISSSLISTVLLLFSARLLSPSSSDLFGIIYSLGQQLFVIGLFQVRDYQATDVREKFDFQVYLETRIVTILLMIGTTFVFAAISHYTAEKTLIFLVLVMSRAIDAFSDVFQGFFQQHERSDLAGKILFFRSIVIMISFYLFLLTTGSLLIACLGIFSLNVLLTFLLDFRYISRYFSHTIVWRQHLQIKKIWSVLLTCFPLFLSGFLINYIFNEPKLVIDSLLSSGQLQAGLQRDFNILFMPTFIMSLLLMILRPLITDLSRVWLDKDYHQFYSSFLKLILILLGFGLFVVIAGYVLGTEVLGLLYGVPLTQYKWEFVILLVGGILNVLASVIGNMMTIFRKQVNFVIVYVLTFILSKTISTPLITNFGMLGAAYSFMISMIAFLVLSIGVFLLTKKLLNEG
ncbi:lipopolysaccharide biosynthesis protein [Streptococcus sciuri]|uniref:Lipopolysaccharide biosynthesis protein n=1 Tax=Streptococcus sciuri TaxID=2973939 RepID=A0ABT2F6I4_9STRE|nr:lipopolysaccharide biosynthesis protein [Streptococcus sciuri]MCS4488039.1 lipopolysaccharide biosynthesis protein [Streptococcus sciuri]